VPRKIRLGSLFPEDLNLNGDQANLLVLKKRLELRGVSSLVVDIPLNKIDDVDFLFLGHGSIAAWEFISRSEPRLFAQLSSFVESSTANPETLFFMVHYAARSDTCKESRSC